MDKELVTFDDFGAIGIEDADVLGLVSGAGFFGISIDANGTCNTTVNTNCHGSNAGCLASPNTFCSGNQLCPET